MDCADCATHCYRICIGDALDHDELEKVKGAFPEVASISAQPAETPGYSNVAAAHMPSTIWRSSE